MDCAAAGMLRSAAANTPITLHRKMFMHVYAAKQIDSAQVK
jgi:hypothetical protein